MASTILSRTPLRTTSSFESCGVAPTDTLTAEQNIARNPSNQAQQLFALLDAFYPVPAGKAWSAAPFIPYLYFAPSAWTLSLVYAGGGLNSPGGIAIDSEGNLWTADNCLVGSQSTVWNCFGVGLSKLAPNGDVWALDNEKSQIVYLPKGDATKGRILGRTVKGKPVDGTLQVKGPFHLAIDQQDRIWVSNSRNTVTRFPASDPGKAEQITVGYVPRGVAIDSLGCASMWCGPSRPSLLAPRGSVGRRAQWFASNEYCVMVRPSGDKRVS